MKVHEFRDARTGLVVSRTSYPADWTVISKPIYTFDAKVPSHLIQIEGPDPVARSSGPVPASSVQVVPSQLPSPVSLPTE